MANRIEVKYKLGIDSRGEVIKNKLISLMEEGAIPQANINSVDVVDSYTINKNVPKETLKLIAESLTNPVSQIYQIDDSFKENCDFALEIGFKPGVTDNVATTARKGIEAKLNELFDTNESVHSTRYLLINGQELNQNILNSIGNILANPLIENIVVKSGNDFLNNGFLPYVPQVILENKPTAMVVPIRDISESELKLIAKQGILDPITKIRRGPLALDVDEGIPIKIIQQHFEKLKRDPTDVELECLAQTWSEHCKHTIFAANLDDELSATVNNIYKTFIRGATNKIRTSWKNRQKEDYLLSVFKDNSGIIKFNEEYAITVKVETHNSPSALDPYGGAITGIVGVDRDAVGAGLGAMPYNHRFFFCFADPKSKRQLFKNKNQESGLLEQKILSPRSIMDGVIEGVKDGGNKSGIPTPQGSAFFHDSFSGKPLVFVGVDGILPLKSANRNSWEKKAKSGDLVVMLGGRVGLDGIHGATFSSESMDSGSPASAVQIGDPITQKKSSDAIVKELRDKNLYTSITDNGAGGLSCSVYEMAKESGGANIDLNKVPLKYPGMRPDQILISESQERFTFSVPKNKIVEFMKISKKHDVEATVIGEFNDSKKAVASFNGELVLDLDLDFFHDGLPQRNLKTTWTPDLYKHEEPFIKEQNDLTNTLNSMLSRLNICSKEFIYEQFDHEVQGGSVIKPMVGKGKVDSDATITRPVLSSMKGVVSTQSLYPRYSLIDTYHMASCAIDTAVRNMIAAGAKLDRMVLLDNFCWCSSDEPERLGQLKRAAKACFDYATVYQTPFVSGKDSMFNTFKGFDENGNTVKIDALPALLISGQSIIPDVRKCQTLEAKVPGDLVYIINSTKKELGGSEYHAMIGESDPNRNREFVGGIVPSVNATFALEVYRTVENIIESGLVASCASVGVGGIGVTLAKIAIGGQLGMQIELDSLLCSPAAYLVKRIDHVLFSESQSRFVVTVDPEKKYLFENKLNKIPYACIGFVSENNSFTISKSDKKIIDSSINDLSEAYKKTLRGY